MWVESRDLRASVGTEYVPCVSGREVPGEGAGRVGRGKHAVQGAGRVERQRGRWSFCVAVISLQVKSAASILLVEASRQAWEEISEGIPQGLPGDVRVQHPFPYSSSTGSQVLSQYSRHGFNTFISPWCLIKILQRRNFRLNTSLAIHIF